MKKSDKPLEPSEEQMRMTVKVEFPSLNRKFEIEGLVFADLTTGAFRVEGENGTFVNIPKPERFTGKKKSRLELLHNL